MSGPIVRKYGFPNFDKIFGERDLQHGVDEAEAEEAATEKPAGKAPKAPKAEPKSKSRKK